MAVCFSCSAENREGARFCDSCGAALAESPAAREERKVVTVLFTDLVGFTGRAEQQAVRASAYARRCETLLAA